MKKDIHPKYYPKAQAQCACGHKFTVGATVPEFNLEICNKCHPFYTGRAELIDIAGRVERFRARQTKASATKTNKKRPKAKKK
jgi:large subunit ribosomal protein L31